MKKILIILLTLISYSVFAQTKHYVKNGGNDLASGANDANAWATIAKVNTHTFIPGDTIAFKCGDTWRLDDDPGGQWSINEIGSSGSNIVFTSYDSGDKPRILGSKTTTWTNVSGSTWSSDETFDSFTTGRIWFETLAGSVVWGILETSIPNLSVEYEYFYNSGDSKVYVYAATDPDTRYTAVEVPQQVTCIELQGNGDSCEYVTFDNLDIAYATGNLLVSEYPGGITGRSRTLKGVEVRNCHIHHVGYQDSPGAFALALTTSHTIVEDNEIEGGGRRNMCIVPYDGFISDSIDNVIVRRNYFHGGWHTSGCDIMNLDATCVVYNVFFYGNRFDDGKTEVMKDDGTGPNYMYFDLQGVSTGQIRNIYIYNNIFLYTRQNAIDISDADYIYVYNNTFYGDNDNAETYKHILTSAGTNNYHIEVKNNIFYVNHNYNVALANQGTKTNWDVDYNLYYYSNATYPLWYYNNIYYTAAQFTTYKTASGYDANSPTPANPLFINVTDPMEYDSLMIDITSPAKDAGVGLGNFTTYDYRDSLRDGSPDIGAYEYGGTNPDIPPDPPTVTTTTPTIKNVRASAGGGNVTSNGGGTVSARGIVWATHTNPDLTDNKTSNGTGTGAFTSWVGVHNSNDTIHVRSYATNETATVYGSDVEWITPKAIYSDSLAVGTTYIDSLFIRNDSLIFRFNGKEVGIVKYNP